MIRFSPLPETELAQARHAGLTADERNALDLVLAAYDVTVKDADADLSPFYAPDYRDHATGVVGGDLAGFQAFLKGFREAFPEAEIAMDRVLTDRSYVFVQGRGRQWPTDPWSHTMEVFRVESNRIAEHWEVLEIAQPPQS